MDSRRSPRFDLDLVEKKNTIVDGMAWKYWSWEQEKVIGVMVVAMDIV